MQILFKEKCCLHFHPSPFTPFVVSVLGENKYFKTNVRNLRRDIVALTPEAPCLVTITKCAISR